MMYENPAVKKVITEAKEPQVSVADIGTTLGGAEVNKPRTDEYRNATELGVEAIKAATAPTPKIAVTTVNASEW